MSRFSGKCDLYDSVCIHCDTEDDIQEFIDNADFYIWIGDRRHHLNITNQKELALYYPYLISIGGHSDGRYNITLSSDCFIDSEERDRLENTLKLIIKDYKKYKRKKLKFTYKKYFGDYDYFYIPEYEKELARRVEKYGEKADIEDVHSAIHEHYRKEWYDALVELEWSEEEAFQWVYRTYFNSEKDRQERFERYEVLKDDEK